MARPVKVRGEVVALALLAATIAVGFGFGIRLSGSAHFPGAPSTFGEWPVLGEWLPHVGIGTPLSILLAIAVIAWGPDLAARLSWRKALLLSYSAGVGWILSLALIDGWQRGIAGQLTSQDEYLSAVPGITDIGVFLRTFSARILDFRPDSLITHVAGHPPGATLVFVWLDRLGLSGGGWAAIVCVLVGALTTVAVPVAVAALGKPSLARATLPFMVLFPGAVWMGVSADALFAGVTACGIALLAVRTRLSALAGGLLLGFGAFLSYGLALIALLALCALLCPQSGVGGMRRPQSGVGGMRRPQSGVGGIKLLIIAVLAACAVVSVFAWAGFWWFDGYGLVVERYYQGIANDRPYWYWVWANLACLALVIGPAVAAGLPRAWKVPLVAAALVAVLLADVSGLSKSEVERIWLPFAVWLVPAAGTLPAPRRWLAAQAVTALMVNHLLLTNW